MQEEYRKYAEKGLCVVLVWTPAHLRILEKRPDKLAKEAVQRSGIKNEIKLSESEGKSAV